ncbi:unnamed protein product [Lampetra fluviatilis]
MGEMPLRNPGDDEESISTRIVRTPRDRTAAATAAIIAADMAPGAASPQPPPPLPPPRLPAPAHNHEGEGEGIESPGSPDTPWGRSRRGRAPATPRASAPGAHPRGAVSAETHAVMGERSAGRNSSDAEPLSATTRSRAGSRDGCDDGDYGGGVDDSTSNATSCQDDGSVSRSPVGTPVNRGCASRQEAPRWSTSSSCSTSSCSTSSSSTTGAAPPPRGASSTCAMPCVLWHFALLVLLACTGSARGPTGSRVTSRGHGGSSAGGRVPVTAADLSLCHRAAIALEGRAVCSPARTRRGRSAMGVSRLRQTPECGAAYLGGAGGVRPVAASLQVFRQQCTEQMPMRG